MTKRNPDATVRVLDYTAEALAQLATAIGGGGGGGTDLTPVVAAINALAALVATEATLATQFGEVMGEPVIVNTTDPTPVATPSPGKAVLLKWLGFAIDDDSSTNIITVRWDGGTGDIVSWPLGRVPAFMHRFGRRGEADESVEVVLTQAGQDVYVNVDWEEVEP